jgi:hypothetical protein
VRTDEHSGDEDDDPSWASPYVDGAWGRTANPNTADGELQNIAAFSAGISRLTGSRRTAARIVVWAILFAFIATAIVGVVSIVSIW